MSNEPFPKRIAVVVKYLGQLSLVNGENKAFGWAVYTCRLRNKHQTTTKYRVAQKRVHASFSVPETLALLLYENIVDLNFDCTTRLRVRCARSTYSSTDLLCAQLPARKQGTNICVNYSVS